MLTATQLIRQELAKGKAPELYASWCYGYRLSAFGHGYLAHRPYTTRQEAERAIQEAWRVATLGAGREARAGRLAMAQAA